MPMTPKDTTGPAFQPIFGNDLIPKFRKRFVWNALPAISQPLKSMR